MCPDARLMLFPPRAAVSLHIWSLSYFLGEAQGGVGSTGQRWIRHLAPHHRGDGVDETGLSAADGPEQKDPEIVDAVFFGLIVLQELKIFPIVSEEKEGDETLRQRMRAQTWTSRRLIQELTPT